MRILNPFGLLGLLTLPLIVGLHLHLERNRREIVSSIFLWQFLEAKFQGEKPKFIKISWLLFLDLSIAFVFSLALSEPQLTLPTFGNAIVQQVILIDDSVSMMANDGSPTRFAVAKDLVKRLIDDSQRQDEVIVLTFGGKVEKVGTTFDSSKRELSEMVMDLTVEGYGIDLRGGLAMAQSLGAADLPMKFYVVTDAAYETKDVSDFPLEIEWLFIGFEGNNQAVLSPVVDDLGDGRQVLFTRIANYAHQPIDRDIIVRMDDEIIQRETLKIAGKSLLPYELSLRQQFKVIEIQLDGEDMLDIDDQAVISIPRETHIQVALIADEIEPIARAVSAVPDTNLTIYAPGDEIPDLLYDLIIYRGITPEILPSGTVVVFDPQQEDENLPLGNTEKINDFLTAENHPLLNGLDIAGIRWESAPNWNEALAREQSEINSFIPLIQAGEQPLLLEMANSDGKKIILLPELSNGNFTKSPAFPIFIRNLVDYCQDEQFQTTYRYGDVLELPEQTLSQDPLVMTPSDEDYGPPEGNGVLLKEIGVYSLSWMDEYGDRIEWVFGTNGGDMAESNIAPSEWRFLVTPNEDVTLGEIQSIEVNLAPWLLFVGMVLLGFEAWRAWR